MFDGDHEAMICAMATELAEAGELPESIRLMNEQAIQSILDGALSIGPFTQALLDEIAEG